MQGQQPVRQTDQAQLLQQQGNIIIKMNDVAPITSVGMFSEMLIKISGIQYYRKYWSREKILLNLFFHWCACQFLHV